MGRGKAAIAYNAFLSVGPPLETSRPGIRSGTAVAFGESGQRNRIVLSSSPLPAAARAAQLPGPDRVEAALANGRIS